MDGVKIDGIGLDQGIGEKDDGKRVDLGTDVTGTGTAEIEMTGE